MACRLYNTERCLQLQLFNRPNFGVHFSACPCGFLVENTGDDRAERPYVQNSTYFIYYGEGAKQVAEGVFGPSLREGVCYTSEELSRKQIVPRITKVLTGN